MINAHHKNASIEEVRAVELRRPPRAGRMWRGIPHAQLLDVLQAEFDSRAWEVTSRAFSLIRFGADLVGGLGLRLPKVTAPAGLELAMGFFASNSMARSLQIYAGATVTICHNGLATGELLLARRHTIAVDLEKEIREALDHYTVASRQLGKIEAALRGRELAAAEAEHLLCESGRRGLMPWSRVGEVDEVFRAPPHPEYGRGTSWCLLQAFTQIAQRNPPGDQLWQINGFREMLPLATAA